MARSIRLLASSGDWHLAGLASRLRQLQDEGPVLFVTADRPHAAWAAPLAQAGVAADRLCIIDAVSAANGQQPATRPANVVFLPSPTMLEMLVLRIEQSAARCGAAHVVLDSLTMLALYNGLAPVQAFAHYLVNRLRTAGLGADLVLREGPSSAALRDRVLGFVDAAALLEAPQ